MTLVRDGDDRNADRNRRQAEPALKLDELKVGATVSGSESLERGQHFVSARHSDQATSSTRREGSQMSSESLR